MSDYQLAVLSIVVLLCSLATSCAYFTGNTFELGVFFAMAAAVFWFVLGDVPKFRKQTKKINIVHGDVD